MADTLSLSGSSTTSGLFPTGMLYQQDFFDPISSASGSNKGSGKNKIDSFDTTSLRSQEETISLISNMR